MFPLRKITHCSSFKTDLLATSKFLNDQDKKLVKDRLFTFYDSYIKNGFDHKSRELFRFGTTLLFYYTLLNNNDYHIILVFTESDKKCLVFTTVGKYDDLIKSYLPGRN